MRMIRGAFDSIYYPPIVHTMSFLPKTKHKFHAKYQILDTPSQNGTWDDALKEMATIAT